MNKLRAFVALFSFYLLSFLGVSAHVKWFVASEEVIKKYHGFFNFYTIESKEVWIWSILLVGWVSFFALLDKMIDEPLKIKTFGEKHKKGINRIAQTVLGLCLVFIALFWKNILIPNLGLSEVFTLILSSIQVLVGLMFVLNIHARSASVLLVGLCLSLGFMAGWEVFLENLLLLTLGVYFLVQNSSPTDAAYGFQSNSIAIVRIGAGVSLITLALMEKIIYPELSLAFLTQYNWNFLAPIFPWFNNSLFVLSAGFVEIGFGILLIMGYLIRFTTIMFALFLIASASAMYLSIGDWEPGHMMIYSAAILFIFFGAGLTSFTKKG